jgi:transposase
VIALVVTPEGFPLAYAVMPGNTSDKTTLRAFLEKLEKQYGKAQPFVGSHGHHSSTRCL